jgi:hypothetical protein
VTKLGSESDLAEGLVINGEILLKVPRNYKSRLLLSTATNPKVRNGAQKPKDIQQPHNHYDNDDGIQNRFYRSCHRYVGVHEPKKNTNYNQGQSYLN